MSSNESKTIIYVTRDIERAYCPSFLADNVVIIANSSSFAKTVQKQYGRTKIVLIENSQFLSTRALLEHDQTAHTLLEISRTNPYGIVVFKSNQQIEQICKKREWQILNPAATVTQTIEQKISQTAWLGNLANFLPPHSIDTMSDIQWGNTPIIVQFNHSHTGNGIVQVKNEGELQKLQKQFPDRPVRVMPYINGPTYTLSGIVTPERVFTGSVSYQITGVRPFTDNDYATVGNDWGAASTHLTQEQSDDVHTMALHIGEKMKSEGYCGAYGIDGIVDSKTNSFFLLEVNARQPASVCYESILQIKKDTKYSTIFDLHIQALLGHDANETMVQLHSGAQIIQRVTADTIQYGNEKYVQDMLRHIKDARLEAIHSIETPGTRIGEELIRFRTDESFIQEHGQLNALAKHITQHIPHHAL